MKPQNSTMRDILTLIATIAAIIAVVAILNAVMDRKPKPYVAPEPQPTAVATRTPIPARNYSYSSTSGSKATGNSSATAGKCKAFPGLQGEVVYLADRNTCQHRYAFFPGSEDEQKLTSLVATLPLVGDPSLLCKDDVCLLVFEESVKVESQPTARPTSRSVITTTSTGKCRMLPGLSGRVVLLEARGLCQHGYTFSRAQETKVMALVARMSLVEDPILACNGDECTILLLEAAK